MLLVHQGESAYAVNQEYQSERNHHASRDPRTLVVAEREKSGDYDERAIGYRINPFGNCARYLAQPNRKQQAPTANHQPNKNPTNIETPVITGLSDISSSLGSAPQRGQARAFEFIAVKQILSIERDEPSIRMRSVDAALLHRTNVERIPIHELRD